jgi:hypothetical protein
MRDGAPPARGGSRWRGLRASKTSAGSARGVRRSPACGTARPGRRSPPGTRVPVSQGRRTPAPVWRTRAAGAGGSPSAPGRARGPHEWVARVGRAWRDETGGGRPRAPRRCPVPPGTDAGWACPARRWVPAARWWRPGGGRGRRSAGGTPAQPRASTGAQQGFAGDAQ